MTDRTCPACDGAIDTGTICAPCAATLQRNLAAIPDAITELHTQLAKQARTNPSPLPTRDPDPDPDWHAVDMLAIASHPLPYHPGASEVLDLLRSVLVGWTRDLWESGYRNAPRTRQNGPYGPYGHETPGLAPGTTPGNSEPTGRPQP